MTREEREKAVWDSGIGGLLTDVWEECLVVRLMPGGLEVCHETRTETRDLLPAELLTLRDALNHRIRELGVEDPLEEEMKFCRQQFADLIEHVRVQAMKDLGLEE